ncbi:MAG TPA: hypothetical protein VF877_01615 [Gaiellaceae bacterium]
MSSATCDKAGHLRPLPLDGVNQLRVRDRDRRLVGECLDELHLLVGERSGDIAADRDGPDQLVVENNRNAEQRAISDHALCLE